MSYTNADLRPQWQSHYNERYCQIAYDLLSDAKSIYRVCSELACSYNTIRKWRRENPDFNEAIEKGLAKAQDIYCDKQEDNLGNPKYNHDGHRWAEFRRFGVKPEAQITVTNLRKAVGFNEKFSCVEKEIEQGTLTAKEAVMLSKVLIDGSQLDKHDSLSKRLESLEKAMEEE